jgi:hypothetical protein
VIVLAWANRHRWGIVLKPNKGRIIGAFVLAALTPFIVFTWVPWVVGGWVLFFFLVSLTEHWWTWTPSFFGAMVFLVLILLHVFWYAVSCLIVSGIQSRRMRVALYALMFWTAYSAFILAVGTQIYRI